MTSEDDLNSSKKIVSIRISSKHRNTIKYIGTRLLIKESKLYRLAINTLLSKLKKLNDPNFSGSDLLPLFLELRGQFIEDLEIKTLHLFRIINKLNADPSKFVNMCDVELLLVPDHLLRERLSNQLDAQSTKNIDVHLWLQDYLLSKYGLVKSND